MEKDKRISILEKYIPFLIFSAWIIIMHFA